MYYHNPLSKVISII